jgi:PAS domain S-box-containing protein
LQDFIRKTKDLPSGNISNQESKKLSLYLDLVGVILVALDKNGFITLLNKKGYEVLHYEEGDLLGKNWFEQCIPKHNKDDVYEVFKKLMKGDLELVEYYENPILTKDNEKRIIAWHNTLLINNKGEITGTLSSGEDITERIKVEKQLIDSEEKYRSMINDLDVGFYQIDLDGLILSHNPTFSRIFGVNPSESLVGVKVDEFWQNIANRSIYLGDIMKTGYVKNYIVHARKKSGESVVLQLNSHIAKKESDERVIIEGTLTDVTEKFMLEQILKESEEKFRTIAEQSFMGIIILQDGVYQYINKQAEKINGYTIEEMKSWEPYEFLKLIHPDHKDFVLEQAKRKQSGDIKVVNHYQYQLIKGTGEVIWVDNFSKSINYRGRYADLVMVVDITDNIIAQQKLRESEEKYRNMINNLELGFFESDFNGEILSHNPGLNKILGFNLSESLVGMSTMDFWEDPKLAKEFFKEILRKETVGNYIVRAKKKNGDLIFIDTYSHIVRDVNDRVTRLECILSDITEIKRAEEKSKELSEIKTELLRRTSHELKTPLVSIKGFTELLSELYYDKLDSDGISIINDIKDGCRRLEVLIKDLLKSSKLESERPLIRTSRENLSFLINYSIEQLKSIVNKRNQRVKMELPKQLIINIEKEEIFKVLVNLLSNAIKYTPQFGEITIKSQIKDDFVVTSIKDNGIGFTEEEKTKIFKPFGKIEHYGQGLDVISEGSGLGLHISKRIIELHGGEIWMESEGRNKGSNFYFSLPLTKK